MRVLITGADLPLGKEAARRFHSNFELRLTGRQPAPKGLLEQEISYTKADLRDPEATSPLVSDVDCILHLAEFHATLVPTSLMVTEQSRLEQERIDHASRGTYVLLREAVKSGVQRAVFASRLGLMADYPEEYVVDETWQPLPRASADSLSPYLGELVCRECAREGRLKVICLRCEELDGSEDSAVLDAAIRAIERAMIMDLPDHGHSWLLYHIASKGRFVSRSASRPPLRFS